MDLFEVKIIFKECSQILKLSRTDSRLKSTFDKRPSVPADSPDYSPVTIAPGLRTKFSLWVPHRPPRSLRYIIFSATEGTENTEEYRALGTAMPGVFISPMRVFNLSKKYSVSSSGNRKELREFITTKGTKIDYSPGPGVFNPGLAGFPRLSVFQAVYERLIPDCHRMASNNQEI